MWRIKGRLLTRRVTGIFSALCSYSISPCVARIAVPLQRKLPQWLKRSRTDVFVQPHLRSVSVLEPPVTHKINVVKRPMRAESSPLPACRGLGNVSISTNHAGLGRRRGGWGVSAPPPDHVGCARWNSLTSMRPAGTRSVCQLWVREVTCEHPALKHANKMTHGVLNIWPIWTALVLLHRPALFLCLDLFHIILASVKETQLLSVWKPENDHVLPKSLSGCLNK